MAKIAKYNDVPGCADPTVSIQYQDGTNETIVLELPSDSTRVRVILDGADIRGLPIRSHQTTRGEQTVGEDSELLTPSEYLQYISPRYPIRFLRQITMETGYGGFLTEAVYLLGQTITDWETEEETVIETEIRLSTEQKSVSPQIPDDVITRTYYSWPEFQLAYTKEAIIPDGSEFNPSGSETKTIPSSVNSITVECSECDPHCVPFYDDDAEDYVCLCRDEPGKVSSDPEPKARIYKSRPPVPLR
jgi:hypothetical protein